MKYKWLCVFLILGLLIPSYRILAQREATACKVVSLFSAWARSSPDGAPNGAVFGFVVNLSSENDTLIGVSTDIAETAEVQEMVMDADDMMQMRPVEGGLVVAANSYQELQPDGYHIMLINLKEPLEAGQSFDLILHFKTAGDVEVQVPIRNLTATDESMPDTTEPTSQSSGGWDEDCQKLYVLNAWARPAGAGMPTSAAYALLLNLTDQDDMLTGVSTSIAQAADMHQMSMGDNDVMQMSPVEGGIAVQKGAAVILKPGGYHIMLMGLNQTMQAGDLVDFTFTFAESGDMQLSIPVQEPPNQGMSPMDMQDNS